MFQILTLNKISKTGLAHFDPAVFTCADDYENPDAVIVRSASMHEMELPENLLAIARAGAGTNNIPIDKCTERGVAVFNSPGANAKAVKELVLCALFLTSRRIVEGTRWIEGLKGEGAEVGKKVEKGKSQFVGPEILGKTLAVIGLGAIGTKVANDARALGMRVIAWVYRNPEEKKKLLSEGIEVTTDLDAVLKAADYVSLHVPSNDSTRGMISADAIGKMKDGVRLLNFARADLVDEASLLSALESGKVSAYATDFATDSLLCTPGVIAIPHLGASTPESEENCAVMAVNELSDYLCRGNVTNSVNLPSLSLPREGKTRLAVISRGERREALKAALEDAGIAVNAQAAGEKKGVGYALFDTDGDVTDETIEKLRETEGVIAIRII